MCSPEIQNEINNIKLQLLKHKTTTNTHNHTSKQRAEVHQHTYPTINISNTGYTSSNKSITSFDQQLKIDQSHLIKP